MRHALFNVLDEGVLGPVHAVIDNRVRGTDDANDVAFGELGGYHG